MGYTHRATIISITLSNPDSTALVTNIWARRMGGRSTPLKAFEYIPQVGRQLLATGCCRVLRTGLCTETRERRIKIAVRPGQNEIC